VSAMARPKRRFHAIELETERFRLVPIRPLSLARPTLHWTKDTETFRNAGWWRSEWNLRRWRRHLRHQIRGDRMCHGIWPKAGGPCIGLHMISVSAALSTGVIGVIICDRDWWGKGVVIEIREAIVGDGFERLNLQRMTAQVRVRNLPSVYNHRKLGFVHEGTLRSAAVEPDGTRVDMLVFGMLRSEWLARKESSRGNGG